MKYILFIGFLLSGSLLFSQKDLVTPYRLSHRLSEKERAEYQKFERDYYRSTAPPEGRVRNIAEFEPTQGIMVTYDSWSGFGVPFSLLTEIAEDDKLYIIVGDSDLSSVQTALAGNGVNTENCEYIIAETDSWWSRDYSPWSISIDNSATAIVDFPYNRPRPYDDQIPAHTADYFELNYFAMNVVHTGGNYMCDGLGTAAQTDLVLEENTLSENEINEEMLDYLGIKDNHFLPDPLGDYIKHIDCWGKFLDIDKVIIGQVSESDSRYEDFEAAADYWASRKSPYGNNYQVFRVFTPGGNDVTPYTNSLILNNKVFVPQSGSDWDDDALAVYEQAMPGYEIHGIYSGGWYNTDALHCRTHELADSNMLYIRHYPLLGQKPAQDSYNINAFVRSYGGSPVSSVQLFYRFDSQNDWQTLDMPNVGGNYHHVKLPVNPAKNTLAEYYIRAENQNGKVENNPYIGAADPHRFTTNGNTNNCPTTDAGNDISVVSGEIVSLNAAANDIDNDELTYLWQAPPGVYLSTYESLNTGFNAPETDIEIQYDFVFTAKDQYESSVPSVVTVTVVPGTIQSRAGKKLETHLYPIPAKNHCVLEVEQDSDLEIFSVSGKLEGAHRIETGKNYIYLEHLSKGVYFFKIKNSESAQIIKLIKN